MSIFKISNQSYYLVTFILVFIVIYYYINLFNKREALDATISTNPFSDLRCVSDDLPIVRVIDNKSLQCLSKSGNDTENCMMKSDFSIDPSIKCNDINTYLVKQIRDKKSPVTKVFNKLNTDVDYNLLTCNPEAMKSESHWCGKLYNVIKNEKCDSNEGKYGFWSNPCKKMPEYVESPSIGSDVSIIDKNQILQKVGEDKLISDISRNKALCGSIKPCNKELVTGGGRGGKVTCRFVNENNGNIAIYDNSNKKIWESKTGGGNNKPYTTILQENGNLVVIDKNSKIVWQSGSLAQTSSKLHRANLLERSGSCILEITDKDNNPIWSSQQ
jgi:hypothetical protein